jgi:uncharacterized protein YsxB (DUF464 family)
MEDFKLQNKTRYEYWLKFFLNKMSNLNYSYSVMINPKYVCLGGVYVF